MPPIDSPTDSSFDSQFNPQFNPQFDSSFDSSFDHSFGDPPNTSVRDAEAHDATDRGMIFVRGSCRPTSSDSFQPAPPASFEDEQCRDGGLTQLRLTGDAYPVLLERQLGQRPCVAAASRRTQQVSPEEDRMEKEIIHFPPHASCCTRFRRIKFAVQRGMIAVLGLLGAPPGAPLGSLLGVLLGATVAAADTVILIPDSANDKVWAFSPADGSLVSDNFIPNDGRLKQPICAASSGQNTIFVSDENADAVFEYSSNGVYLRTIVGSAQGLDSPYGIAVHSGLLYITSPTQKRVWRCGLDGSGLITWWNAAPFNAEPRDILFRTTDALVTDSIKDAIERVDFDGNSLGVFVDSDGITGIDFPQQLQSIDQSVLVAGFNAPAGLYVYDFSGVQTLYSGSLATAPRGCLVLDSGEYLYAGGTRVMAYNPRTQLERVILNQTGASFRYAERFELGLVCPGDLNGDGVIDGVDLSIMLGAWGGSGADLDGNGTTNAADLSILLGGWGAC